MFEALITVMTLLQSGHEVECGGVFINCRMHLKQKVCPQPKTQAELGVGGSLPVEGKSSRQIGQRTTKDTSIFMLTKILVSIWDY